LGKSLLLCLKWVDSIEGICKISMSQTIAELEEEIAQKDKELFRLSLVASKTNNAIVIMDSEGNLEWLNEAFTTFSGYTLPDLFKANVKTIFELSTNTDFKQIFNKCVTDKKPVVYESKHIGKNSQNIWIANSLTPILDENEEIIKFIIIATDITERKIAEDIIKEKNKDITDSIKYAKRIQEAILPPDKLVQQYLPESFILYKPKDIVSGDFYWIEKAGDKILFAAVDCTGHGVPGAFVSIVGHNGLSRAINEFKITQPSLILDKLNEIVGETFRQEDNKEVKDGMDIALCSIDFKNQTLEYAGAMNSLYIISNNELKEINADKQPIGAFDNRKNFTNHSIKLKSGDHIYIFSDGYSDQFGGPKGKKFLYKRFQELLLSIHAKPMKEQKEILDKTIMDWKGNYEQLDDILVIGVKI